MSTFEVHTHGVAQTDDSAPHTRGGSGSLFARAYGKPAGGSGRGGGWPRPAAGAPRRAPGSIGPVAPMTVGLAQQSRNMMLAAGRWALAVQVGTKPLTNFGPTLCYQTDNLAWGLNPTTFLLVLNGVRNL